MNSIVHFEIHATEPEKLGEFYKALFGWEIVKYELPGMEYWGVITAEKGAPNAINGGLVKRGVPAPSLGATPSAFVCTVQVDDIDAMMKKAAELGAVEAMAKFALPGMAWQGYMIDPDHNIFGLHQADPNAK
ncbi:MAG: VOC family protein [Patescibacteria group bacterium]|jgi:hypothetical protein